MAKLGIQETAGVERLQKFVVAQTGFALAVPDSVPLTRVPGEEELRLIREVLDPGSRRDAEVSSGG